MRNPITSPNQALTLTDLISLPADLSKTMDLVATLERRISHLEKFAAHADEDRLLSAREAARLARRSPLVIRADMVAGRIPTVERPGGKGGRFCRYARTSDIRRHYLGMTA